MLTRTCLTLACIAATAALGPAAAAPGAAAPAADPGTIVLTPHRAIYDLRLLRSRGKREIQSVRGRILYDFSGSPCDGYALNFRQVSELDSGESKSAMTDLRATTWEDGAAKRFRFNSENYLNDSAVDKVDGEADRGADHVGVKLSKPRDKTFDLDHAMVFPTEQIRRIIAAAREGKTVVEMPLYDGSDNGEKVYSTMTLIGHPIAPDEKVPTDAAANQPALKGLTRWPVTISYFDRNDPKREEQTPVYAITFELYENGISRALQLDYDDFVIAGDMSQLDIKTVPACK
ncbi:MAG TPA: cell envelope integrity EipB family protein [Xanthobacteraceae bacterium]|nr:cell envelope integrity EipB family protein [Xanthobacteraceae bacterium]